MQYKLHLVIIMGKVTAGVFPTNCTNRMGELYLGQLVVQHVKHLSVMTCHSHPPCCISRLPLVDQ